jgi:hypothetical protein
VDISTSHTIEGLANIKQGPATRGATVFLRSLFGGVSDNLIYKQAQLVLGVASAAMLRPARDGQWIQARLGQVIPPLDDVMSVFENWINALETSVRSIADVLDDYIDFVKERLVETQQLIRRINSLVNSIVDFPLPKSAGLLLLSSGTDGLLSDFVAAENKPSDSPLAYGGGIVFVAGGAPSFLLELFKSDDKKPSESTLPDAEGADPVITPLPAEPLEPPPGPGDPPEVL